MQQFFRRCVFATTLALDTVKACPLGVYGRIAITAATAALAFWFRLALVAAFCLGLPLFFFTFAK